MHESDGSSLWEWITCSCLRPLRMLQLKIIKLFINSLYFSWRIPDRLDKICESLKPVYASLVEIFNFKPKILFSFFFLWISLRLKCKSVTLCKLRRTVDNLKWTKCWNFSAKFYDLRHIPRRIVKTISKVPNKQKIFSFLSNI